MDRLAFQKLSEYSQISETEVQFNHRGLKPFKIPEINKFDPATGKIKRVLDWNVLKGYQNFTKKTFAPDESRITNFLATIIHYEYHQNQDLSGFPIVALVSLYRDIALHKESSYDVVRFENQWYFSSRELRDKDELKWGYIGIRFEDMLTQGTDKPTLSNVSHYKCMKSLRFPDGTNNLTISEIDCLDPANLTKKFAGFTEVKLCYVPDIPSVLNIDDPYEFLCFMYENKPGFLKNLTAWTVQSLFSSCHNLLVGIRNEKFAVIAIQIFNLKEDVIPFLKAYSPDYYYKKVTEAPVRVEEMLKRLLRYLEGGDENIYKMDISEDGVKLNEIADDFNQRYTFHSVITPEFVNWRLEGKIRPDLKKGHYTYTYDPRRTKTMGLVPGNGLSSKMANLEV